MCYHGRGFLAERDPQVHDSYVMMLVSSMHQIDSKTLCGTHVLQDIVAIESKRVRETKNGGGFQSTIVPNSF